MNSEVIDKQQIIDNICYTELVYGRINKKLGLTYTKGQIEKLILNLLTYPICRGLNTLDDN